MRYTIFAVLSIVFMLFTVQARAHRGGDIDIRIIADNGNSFTAIPFRELRKGRTHVVKKYLEAVKGDNYSIVIRNRTSDRIGVVVAVDGRNIISGKKSYLKSRERMYIIGPRSSTRLAGWRTDLDTVHRFYFTDKSDSYSVRTFRDSSAMGVIAVAAFREKKQPNILRDDFSFNESRSKAPRSPSAKGKSGKYEEESAGTGFGNRKHSRAIKVEFEPERAAFKKLLVKYEWHDTLCEKGILKCRPKHRNRLWDEDEYAPFPPGC